MKKAFTLIEMMISILLTAIVFTYLYATLNDVKKSHAGYSRSISSVTQAQRIFSLFTKDITQIASPIHIVHESGYDRFSLFSSNSVYDMARPWIYYYISQKDHALIRIEATKAINFENSDYLNDQNGTYFFADKLATGCSSLRISDNKSNINLMLKCKSASPIVMTLYKGDK